MRGLGLTRYIPEEVRSLFFIKIFTTYSYAVLYASLVLYMTNELGLSSKISTGVVGVFISLNFLLHFLGGYAGGKLVSNRQLFAGGMVLEVLGLLVIPNHLFLGLGIFLTGCGLYATSINAIMIQQYEPNDDRRELASFWLYSGMNLEFFIGHTVSGYFYLNGDYQSLFSSAVITSVFSLVLMCINWKNLADRTTEHIGFSKKVQSEKLKIALAMSLVLIPLVISALSYEAASSNLVMLVGIGMLLVVLRLALKQPKVADKKKMFAFLILILAGITFWSLFFIGPMGLTLFITNHVDTNLLGVSIPPQWFNNINTSIIVIGGPLLGLWFKRKRDSGVDISVPLLFSIALILIGTAFAIIPLGIYFSKDSGIVAMGWIALSFVLQTLGELFLSPVGVAMIGKLAPRGKQGLLLGIWSMVSGIASMISKYLSQLMVAPINSSLSTAGIDTYSYTFNLVGWGAIAAGLFLLTLVPIIKRLMGSDEEAQDDLIVKQKLANNL